MTVELSENQKATLDLAITWGLHPKNQHPEVTLEVAKNIQSGWLNEDEMLDFVKRGFDLALRGCA